MFLYISTNTDHEDRHFSFHYNGDSVLGKNAISSTVGLQFEILKARGQSFSRWFVWSTSLAKALFPVI